MPPKTVKKKQRIIKPVASGEVLTESQSKSMIDSTIESMRKQFGEGIVMRMGDRKIDRSIKVVSSGSLGLDLALGIMGYPYSRIIELFGPESVGKTCLALHAIANAQKQGKDCAFIDAEHALDVQFAQRIGVNTDDLILSQPDYGEQGLNIVDMFVRNGNVGLIVVDSVAALVPKAELEGDIGDHHVGLQARMMSQALRKLTAIVGKSGTMVIFVNQIRSKIGVMFGNPSTTTGGNALKFYSSVRIEIKRTGSIKRGAAEDSEVIGNRIKAKVVKNKMAPPFQSAEFDLVFSKGINLSGEILDLSVVKGFIEKNGAFYKYQGENIGQGREKAYEWLDQNPMVLHQLKSRILGKDDEN